MAYQGTYKKYFVLVLCLLACSFSFAGTTPNGSQATVTNLGGIPGGPPAIIPAGFFKEAYTTTLQSSFGTPPYTYSLVLGGLPPGVTLNSAGKISGKAGDTGTFSFQIKATDSSKTKVSRTTQYALKVSMGLDIYGGMTAVRSANRSTGFFRMEKQSGRWTFVSPLGSDFYLRSVYNATEGFIEPGIMKSRYNNDTDLWATHRGERLLSWNFNTLGEYTSMRGLPVGTWGGKNGNPVKLPFIMLLNTSSDLLNHPGDLKVAEPIKDIIKGIPTSTYHDYRGILIDVFDPKWQQGYQGEVELNKQAITGGFASVPWIVGITTEDGDYFWALKGTGDNPFAPYPHPSWLIAVTNFQQSGYHDQKLYSKYAWVSYLQSKYVTIGALNAAWGSSYTTFGDQGGYGVGSGVLDEDGRHSQWISKDPYMLTGARAALKADMDAFLYQYAYQMESTAVKAIRSYDKYHLIFGLSALGGIGAAGVRPQVLKALADAGVDVFAFSYDPLSPQNVSTVTAAYDLTGKPAILWYGISANSDSYFHDKLLTGHAADYPTQEIRAQRYATDQAVIYGATSAGGDHCILGVDFWSLTDSGVGESVNWGLTSDRDNAYDGKQAVSAPGTDRWGFPTGGEDRNYGNFIDPATQTNMNIMRQFIVDKVQ